MNNQTILHIDSSGRAKGSITRELSELVVSRVLAKKPDLTVNHRELSAEIPFVDEQWIGANFTPPEQRVEEQLETLAFSDKLVDELIEANTIVIGSPIYNFGIPAVLKAWIDMIARVHRTFRYTENGPIGLLEEKKVLIAMASGGVPIGSEMEFASHYLKQVLAFIGITDVTIIDASKINLSSEKDVTSPEQQIDILVG